jgi:predicted ATPase
MTQEHHMTFGPFRLEMPQGRLWQDDQVIPLRPRSRALLGYLVAHPSRLVTKAELLQHVWRDTHVTDIVLRVAVREIRAALGDAAGAPQYLATVGRQGYRWLGGGDGEVPPPQTAAPLVGRQGTLAALEGWYQQAMHGTRQLVFLSGEAGVGKTTVVEMFLAHLAAGRAGWLARGQCVERYGEGEPYLPFVEALGRLGQGSERGAVLAVLRQYAPRWLVQLPALVSEPELERLQGRLHGTTSTRMLRELAEALEVLTADRMLVLVLEDLQWSDRTTVGALAYLAQRREPSRLLVLGTYRPVEVRLQGHPLRGLVQELCGRGQAVDLPLAFLPAADVAAYVAGRLGGPVAAALVAFVYARTDGNALFMVNLVEHLVQQRLLARQAGQWVLCEGAAVDGLPEGLRQLILRRIEALAPTARRVLETASVVGEAFAVPAVAAGLEEGLAVVEEICDALAAQEHLLTDTGLGVWPDGTRGGSYRFRHALYQQVLYEQVGATRRAHLHGRIGARLAAGYGAQAEDIAATLASHCERGSERQKAVHYWQLVGDTATRRNAHHEAVAALTTDLALLATLPERPALAHHELMLRLTLGESLMAAKGTGASAVGEVYTQAQTLCDQVGTLPQRFRVLQGLYRFHMAQAHLPTAGALAQALADLAHRRRDRALMLEGQSALGSVALCRGDLAVARAHLEHCLSCDDTASPAAPIFRGGHHLRVTYLAWMARLLGTLGYAEQAQQRMQEALTLAQQIGHTPTLAYAQHVAAGLAQCHREVAATYAHADALMTFATAQGLGHRVEEGRILRGWALAMQGDAATGVADMQHGLLTHQDLGIKVMRPYYLALLAEALGQAAQPEAGLTILADACTLVTTTEARWWEAELYRLQGSLLLQLPRPAVDQAECCFQQALEVARRQQARALELRAALSLARLWQGQRKRVAARQLLAVSYCWFTEGLHTADLREAKTLLAELDVQVSIARSAGARALPASRAG